MANSAIETISQNTGPLASYYKAQNLARDLVGSSSSAKSAGLIPSDFLHDEESIKRSFGLTDADYQKYKPYIDRHPFSAPGYKLGDLIRNGFSVLMSGRIAYANDWWQDVLKDFREGESAREANARQEAREDTAYQRTAKDAFAAGLNPWVLMQGGASPMSVNSAHKASSSKENDDSGSGSAFLKLLGVLLLALTKGKSGGSFNINNYR